MLNAELCWGEEDGPRRSSSNFSNACPDDPEVLLPPVMSYREMKRSNLALSFASWARFSCQTCHAVSIMDDTSGHEMSTKKD